MSTSSTSRQGGSKPVLDLRVCLSDDDGVIKTLQSPQYRQACRIFNCQPMVEPEQKLAARLLSIYGMTRIRRVAQFFPPFHRRLLQFSTRVPEFEQLLSTNGGLAVDVLRDTLIHCRRDLRWGAEYIREFLATDSRGIAKQLGWPTDLVGTLGRMWRPAITVRALDTLKQCISGSETMAKRLRKVLQHCRYLAADVVRIVGSPEALDRVENRFLVELCSKPPKGFRTNHGVGSALITLLRLEKECRHIRMPMIHTVKQVRRLVDRYFALAGPHTLENLLSYRIPPPPLHYDDSYFRPLDTSTALVEEFCTMGPNCLPSLIPQIAEGGNLYAYQVLPNPQWHNECATLVIQRDQRRDDRVLWILDDARAKRNQPIAPATRAAIMNFLSRAQGGVAELELKPMREPIELE